MARPTLATCTRTRTKWRTADSRPRKILARCGQPKTARLCFSTCTFRFAKCAAVFATCLRRHGQKQIPSPSMSPRLSAKRESSLTKSATTQLATRPSPEFAIGGGTPTYLGPSQLERVFAIASETLGIDLANTPISVETSPETGTSDRLAVLASAGVDRVSMGVQSFIDSEVAGVGRAQKREQVEETIRAIREHKFATLNLDLMYGLEGQTPESWAHSLDVAMAHGAEEIFIYPLYVRPVDWTRSEAGLVGSELGRRATRLLIGKPAIFFATQATNRSR